MRFIDGKYMIIKKCLTCNKEFKVYNCRKDIAKFCSYKCRGISKKGIHPKAEFKKGQTPWNKGKKAVQDYTWNKKRKRTQMEKNNLRQKALEQFKDGMPEETIKKISKSNQGKNMGSKNGMWKNGISELNERARNGFKSKQWKKEIYSKDNYICKKCNKKGGELHAHHIENFATNKKLRFKISNGITFCKECHIKFHKKHGFENNTLEQVLEFIKQTYDY